MNVSPRIALVLLAGIVCCPAREIDPTAAAAYSRAHRGDVLVIWERGRTFVDCGPGRDIATPLPLMSITKSLTALAFLARRGTEPDGAHDLLRQTSGVAPSYRELYSRGIRDIRSAAMRLPVRAAAGRTFEYGPAHFERLGALAWPDDPRPVSRWLAGLGITSAAWRTDAKGHEFLSAGAVLSAGDLLKVGRILAGKGRAGWRRFLSESALREATTGSAANPAYGAGFWLNTNAARPGAREGDVEKALASPPDWGRFCLSVGAPPDLFAMAGSGGQRVYICPSLGLVVVRLGRPGGFSDPEFLQALLPPG